MASAVVTLAGSSSGGGLDIQTSEWFSLTYDGQDVAEHIPDFKSTSNAIHETTTTLSSRLITTDNDLPYVVTTVVDHISKTTGIAGSAGSTWLGHSGLSSSPFSWLTSADVVGSNATEALTFPSLSSTLPSPLSSSVSAELEEVVLEQVIVNNLNFYFPPVLFVVGCAANVLVIMIMRSKDFRSMSTSFYMFLSSCVDMGSLVVSLPAHYLYVNFPFIFDSVRTAHPMCSFFNLFGWGSSDMGVLLTVAMTTERSLAIQFPLRAPTLCTVKRAKIASACLFVLELLKVGHLLFTSRVAGLEIKGLLCVVDLESDPNYAVFYKDYWPYIHNVFLVVAFIIIIIGNIIITIHVKRSEDSKDMGEGTKNAGGGKGAKTVSKSKQLSLMLIIDSVTIIFCTLPFAIFVVIDEAFQLFEDTPRDQGKKSLVFCIVFYLLYVNRCANFFLYCVSGERFRQSLRHLVACRGASNRRPGKPKVHLAGTGQVAGSGNNRNVVASSITFSTEGDEGGGELWEAVSMNPMGPPPVQGSKSAAAATAGEGKPSTVSTGRWQLPSVVRL